MAHHGIKITIQSGGEIEALNVSGEGREKLMDGLSDTQAVDAIKMWLQDRYYDEASKIIAKVAVDEFVADTVSEAN